MENNKNTLPTSTPQEAIEASTQWHAQQETAEKERIEQWRKRCAELHKGFEYKAHENEETKQKNKYPELYPELQGKPDVVTITPEFNDSKLTESEKTEIQGSSLCAATGTASPQYGGILLGQTLSACFDGKNPAKINAIYEALIAMKPADEYEGQLISRLVVLHDNYMVYLARSASPEQSSGGIDLNVNRATKLMRVYSETLDALTRYRRKGEQRVTVQHVNVNGGQTVVTSNLITQGGDNEKKRGRTPNDE